MWKDFQSKKVTYLVYTVSQPMWVPCSPESIHRSVAMQKVIHKSLLQGH